MEDGKIVKQVAEWKPQGKRKRGRPINTWKDGIWESTKRRELKDEECMDRDLWRRKIMSLGLGKLYIHRKTPKIKKNKYSTHKNMFHVKVVDLNQTFILCHIHFFVL
jgi:hypothetical protein